METLESMLCITFHYVNVPGIALNKLVATHPHVSFYKKSLNLFPVADPSLLIKSNLQQNELHFYLFFLFIMCT